MACGVFHKASKGFWSKVKGVFGRIGSGIKTGATKAYNWLTQNKDKIRNVAGVVTDAIGSEKLKDYTNKGLNMMDKGLDTAHRLGIG